MYINPGLFPCWVWMSLKSCMVRYGDLLHGLFIRRVRHLLYGLWLRYCSFIIRSVHRWNVHGDHSDLLYIFYLEWFLSVISAFILYFITGGVLWCLSEWITVFNVLYQFIYFSGICADISGYEGFTVLCNPDQDEVMAIVYAALVVYDIVRYFYGRSMVYGTADHRILTELYYFLPWYKKS